MEFTEDEKQNYPNLVRKLTQMEKEGSLNCLDKAIFIQEGLRIEVEKHVKKD